MRELELLRTSPAALIVGLTAYTVKETRALCMKAGMSDVFAKPISSEKIDRLIVKCASAIAPQLASIEHGTIFTANPSLGIDLPDAEKNLFELEQFPLFDSKYGLKCADSDLELFIRVLRNFISDDGQQYIRLIQENYTKKNWLEMAKIAHCIKGGVAHIGAIKMRYACIYFERYYKAGHRSLLDELYQQILIINRASIEIIRAWLCKFSYAEV